MKRVPLLMIVAASIFWSCDKNKTETDSKETAKVESATSDSAAANAAQTQTVESQEAANVSTPEQAVAINNSGKKPELNPPHGEPFHRCEIPVGAPIDSQPAPTPAPQMMPTQSAASNNFNTNPIPSTPQPVAAPSAQNLGPKPALNPPHGEPHHRCDLQVGAPLI
ncbi:hypothetical protein [Chryseobacterium koreense]|uniref:hypothetical protein n=1 Tax=Chryseobacterium koreense TaxID=232216 RepID=UPI0026F30284|nr:hypothetical protein [Chryseobacterium koreense]